MTRKEWILITVTIAIVHGILASLLLPISGDIIFSRFDGNDYNAPWEPLLIGLFLFLNFPYLLMTYSLTPFRFLPPILSSYLLIVGNSLIWGLMITWLISKLPMFKKRNISQEME